MKLLSGNCIYYFFIIKSQIWHIFNKKYTLNIIYEKIIFHIDPIFMGTSTIKNHLK